MRVFVTGASGFVGSAVVRQLIGAGHQVTGLARSDRSADAVEAMGAAVLRGDLADLDSLAAGAKAADGVIHCGFIHDFANFAASVEVDRHAIEALGAALAGSGRPFIVTSGIGLVAGGGIRTEEDGAATQGHVALRGASEALALAWARQDVRVCLIRLPPTVHGDGDHGFVPMIIEMARKRGASAYVDRGENRWSAVHREDAARAYLLALERGGAGARYHAVGEEGIFFRDIAAAIGRGLDVPVTSVSREEAAGHFGWMANFAGMDMSASSRLTGERLGWHPTGRGLMEDLTQGTYFTT
jgi:nucleoside-diphosphate-sugar epimerase